MTRFRRSPGSATADYLAAVLAVGLLLLALTALREHRPDRRPAVDPVAHLRELVRRPPPARVAPRARRAPAAPGPRPPRPPRPTVLAPTWASGW